MSQLARQQPDLYGYHLPEPYPNAPRQKVDALIRPSGATPWAVEFKLLRLLGDNGGLNDNMLMHILSPYAAHRSAFTDCQKLCSSGFDARKAVMILGYDAPDFPLGLAIEAFESLATRHFRLGARQEESFQNLIHPIHSSGSVYAWEILGARAE
jgi:hypothetical protein